MATDDYLQLECRMHRKYRGKQRPRKPCLACSILWALNHGQYGMLQVAGRARHREGDETEHGARYAVLFTETSG